MSKEKFNSERLITDSMDKYFYEELLMEDELDIDRDSNHVVDLIDERRFEDAENAARELLQKYPDAIDGLERLGLVFESKGDLSQAIHYYQSAIAFTYVHVGVDQEFRDHLKEKIKELQGIQKE